MEIERVLGKAETADLRRLVHEAQGCVLEIQRQMIDTLRENGRLRERMERCESAAREHGRELRLPSYAIVAEELVGKSASPPAAGPEPAPEWRSVSRHLDFPAHSHTLLLTKAARGR